MKMKTRSLKVGVIAVAVVVLGSGAASCSSDSDSADETSTTAAAAGASSDSTPDTTGAGKGDTKSEVEIPAALTGAEICTKLDASAVAAAVGKPVDTATPSDTDCTYTYPIVDDVQSITVGSISYEDLAPDAAFEMLLSRYAGIYDGQAQTPVEAGKRAVVYNTGMAGTDAAVLTDSGRIFTVSVPSPVADAAPALLQEVAAKLG